jgi:hypothetical protein
MPRINPTVGRVVHYFESSSAQTPLAGVICYVHSETFVNLTVFMPNGEAIGRTSVQLVQDGEPKPHGHRCEWMPFQKGQAAKTEALEAQLAGSPS